LENTPERRHAPRTKLVEIAYIGMGPENGGLVLDVSDGGLSFHSVAPVRASETVQFLLSLRGHSRIEGAGEVVWTNEMKTVCGLRFTSLSAGAREYLNNWSNQSRLARPARKIIPTSAPPPRLKVVEPPVYETEQLETELESFNSLPDPPRANFFESMARSLWGIPLVFRIAFGVLGLALAVAAFIYGVRVGKSETGSIVQPAPAASSSPAPQATEPAPVSVSPAMGDAPSEPAAAPASPGDANAAQPDAPSIPHETNSRPSGTFVNASKTDGITGNSFLRPGSADLDGKASDQHAELALEAGKSELAAALSSLRGTNGVRDSAKAARLLWAAVENNNSTAEVVLADLYLRGDGVDQSCEQGRVLLTAASKIGNAQGQEKLAELNANGCPQSSPAIQP